MATPAWEQSKENAAPLQRGRNVSDLERAQNRSQKELNSVVKSFEALVRPSEAVDAAGVDGDPLADWLAYIKKYQDMMPSDTHNQFLLMERCTRALIKMERYSNDERFIAVCARYAAKTKDPGQVFKYLHQQKVGSLCALFWVAWAFVAEKDGDFPFAEQVFKKGISKKAQPMDMLKIRHRQFQRRMSRHWLKLSDQSDFIDDHEEMPDNEVKRSALVGLSSERARRNDRQQDRPAVGVGLGRTTQSIQQNNQSTKGGFSIFVEPSDENAEPGYDLDASFHASGRRVIERESDRRKENMQRPERWNQSGGLSTLLPQSASAPSEPSFSVFVDEECDAKNAAIQEEDEIKMRMNREVRDERTFQERRAGMADKLAKDPLRYLRNPGKLEADQAKSQTTEKKMKDIKPVNIAKPEKADTKTQIRCQSHLLKDEKGNEQCVEESRAKTIQFKPFHTSFNLLHCDHASNADKGDSIMELEDDSSMDLMSTSASMSFGYRPPIGESRRMSSIAQRKESKESGVSMPDESVDQSVNHTNASTSSSFLNEPRRPMRAMSGREEETINTKFAMKELSMMFVSPRPDIDSGARKQGFTSTGRKKGVDGSYDNIVDLIGNLAVDNSIVGPDEAEYGDRQPQTEPCQGPPIRGSLVPNRRSVLSEHSKPDDDDKVTGFEKSSSSLGFQIFEDVSEKCDDAPNRGLGDSGQIDDFKTSTKGGGFSIFRDTAYDQKLPCSREEPREGLENLCALADITEVEDSGSVDGSITADISLFNGAMQDLDGPPIEGRRDEATATLGGAFEIFVDPDQGNNVS